MLQTKQNSKLRILLSVATFGAVFGSSTVALATEPEEHEWPRPRMLISRGVHQGVMVLQQFDDNRAGCFNVAMPMQQSQCVRMIPINMQERKQQDIDSSDQAEPLPPSIPTPPSDLPQPPDPDPEPNANIPSPAVPPSVQPEPAQPGLPPTAMPEPAAPHLAPPPPPTPQPAEPPPLSQRPDLNPANPGAPEQQPTPESHSKPEPTTF